MFLLKADSQTEVKGGSHDGAGQITRTRLLGDYEREAPGFKFVHDNVLEPGTTIGRHTHDGNEELWLVLSGRASVTGNGETAELGPGDACLARSGDTHELVVLGGDPVHLLVICANA
ncbi:MAG: cupin domain-containing protein [Planctomycetota bacterium]|jgi:mannose-6-phosphate isomerase-like protein (cupin superfamily)